MSCPTTPEDEIRKQVCLQLDQPNGSPEPWKAGQTITVTFFHDPAQDSTKLNTMTPRFRHLVEHYARMWERWTNLKFKFVDSDDADVRITSLKDGSYSTIGPTAQNCAYKDRRTMNLDCDGNDPVTSFSSTVSHQFGHVIGLKHHPQYPFHWIPNAVIDWYQNNTLWRKPEIERGFYNFENNAASCSRWDSGSIMNYYVGKGWNTEGVVGERGKVISEMDREVVGGMYPFGGSPETGAGADKLLDRTSYAVVEAYEYRNGKIYLNLFCQSESYSLYKMTYLFKVGNPKLLDPEWETERIALPLYGSAAPAPATPLTAVKYSMDDYKQVVHMFYLDRENNIRDCVFVNGELKDTNNLNVKVASYSRLSAITWRGKDEDHIRLYYQSEHDDHIQELIGTAKWNGTGPTTTWRMGAYINLGNESPLPGSDLSFVNLTWDTPCIRGFFQTSTGAIKQCQYTNDNWNILPNWMIYDIPYATSFTAKVHDKGKPESQKAVLYFKGRRYAGADEQYIFKAVPGSGEPEAEIPCSARVSIDSRMAFVSSDSGFRLFSTTDGKLMEWASPAKVDDFENPRVLRIHWSSILGQGGKNEGWGDEGGLVEPSKPGPPVSSGGGSWGDGGSSW
ncbi:hypothetical protein TWF730_010376 [Orbilia blumenaviensis]|uniref:Fucose-specific lectin n=1 Tax=Orbilia blumenaviensis TaxID=1796055 RepID=A0AAV9UN44_9PEZI